MTTRCGSLTADELRRFLDATGGEVFELRIKCSILQDMIETVLVTGNTKHSVDRVVVEMSPDQFDAIVWLGGVATATARAIENKIDDLFQVGDHDRG